ncbi:MAG: YggS family pyridoxal phosphate-dependent enzyme [Microthrixaceae bacterium]
MNATAGRCGTQPPDPPAAGSTEPPISAPPMPEVPAAVAELAERVAERASTLRARIDAVGGPDVRLVAVTKAHPPTVAWAASLAGLSDLGENYAQELVAKAEFLSECGAQVRWHMIGGVQTNKVRMLAPHVSWWHTVDRPKLVRELARRVPGATVLIQRNLSGEAQKGGCGEADVEPLLEAAQGAGLTVVGLMGVAAQGSSQVVAHQFASLVAQAEELGLGERCIGMSSDLDAALAAGATTVRVGSLLFGSRPGSATATPARA